MMSSLPHLESVVDEFKQLRNKRLSPINYKTTGPIYGKDLDYFSS